MPKRKRFVLLSCLSLVNTLAFSHENLKSDAQECCGLSPRPQRLEIRHIESKGIGYRQGYTSIEGFFTPTVLSETSSWVPFIDLRGHIFDNNKLAANAGFGLRYLTSRVWGVNAYYDYRGTSHHGHFNQVGFGLESLGKIWDFRINGYLPFGKKRGHFFHTRFHEFSGHHMIISRKRESAMKGANAEIGAHIKKFTYGEFYAAAGPYYFEAEGKNTWGGEGRLALSSKHIKLQVSGSYDPVFHGIVQGELSLIFPLDRKSVV